MSRSERSTGGTRAPGARSRRSVTRSERSTSRCATGSKRPASRASCTATVRAPPANPAIPTISATSSTGAELASQGAGRHDRPAAHRPHRRRQARAVHRDCPRLGQRRQAAGVPDIVDNRVATAPMAATNRKRAAWRRQLGSGPGRQMSTSISRARSQNRSSSSEAACRRVRSSASNSAQRFPKRCGVELESENVAATT